MIRLPMLNVYSPVDSTGRWRPRPRYRTFAWLPMLLIALLVGCQGTKWPEWGRPAEKVPLPKTQPATGTAENTTPLTNLNMRPVVVQTVEFTILRVRAAAGTFSQSEKLWNPVNSDVISADRQLLLRNNGLRIGVAKQAAWPQIKAALDAEKIEVSQDAQVMQNGLPLTIEINAQPRDQTLFLIRSDGTMPGAFFPQSTNALRIEYEIPTHAPDTLVLELIPEIRLQYAPGQSNLTVASLRNSAATPPSRPLRELATRIRLDPDEFLALGPAPVAHQSHLIGSLLLREEIDGRELESMCYITPRIISTAQPGTP